MNAHPSATMIPSHTPAWVWGLLAALIALGLKQARDHVMSRAGLIVMSVVVGLLSLTAASRAFGATPAVLVTWLLSAAAGTAVFTVLRAPLRAESLSATRFRIGGSWLPMAMLLGVFGLRYVVSAALAVQPGLAQATGFALGASLLYGGFAGLFAGRAWRVLSLAPQGQVPLAA